MLNGGKPIAPEFYQRYASKLRKAATIDGVSQELADQWQANVSRFAAYKAYHATQELYYVADKYSDMESLRAVLHKYDRYQAAECNTARTRARTGKQWQQFTTGERAELFPNLRWIASRSATPREAHRVFWGCVWPKNDKFWDKNQPGTLWNCKCDWEETDEAPDHARNDKAQRAADEMEQIAAEAKKPSPLRAPGLEGNPAKTGQLFTDNVAYIRAASEQIIIDEATKKDYPALQSLLDLKIKEYRLDYYSDKGGFLQTSRDRIDEGNLNKQEKEKFEKEHSMCRTLAHANHIIIYRKSVEGGFDIFFDGIPADLKNTKSHNHILDYAKHAIRNQGASIVIFEFSCEINGKIMGELNKIKERGWRCLYYTTKEKTIRWL